jgi:hypothetical protein
MKGVSCAEIGNITKAPRFTVQGLKGKIVVDATVEEMLKSWKRPLRSVG